MSRCVRCFCPNELHRHHIVRRSEGGSDAPENLALLCSECHREWHRHFEGTVEFVWWVENVAPPRIVAFLAKQDAEIVARPYPEVRKNFVAYFELQDAVEAIREEDARRFERLFSGVCRALANYRVEAEGWISAEVD